MPQTFCYAGLWPRFLALTVDLLLFCLLFFPVTRLVKGTWLMGAADHRWTRGLLVTDPLCIAFLAIIALYFVLFEALVGATLGKRLCGLQVIRLGGGTPGLARSAVRNILRLVDGLPAFNILGVVLIVFSAERARFGDRIGQTRVIRKR
jgi:uncharacterized RDD family membrane protein YckC